MLALAIRLLMSCSRPANAPPQMKRMLVVSTWMKSDRGFLRPPSLGTFTMAPWWARQCKARCPRDGMHAFIISDRENSMAKGSRVRAWGGEGARERTLLAKNFTGLVGGNKMNIFFFITPAHETAHYNGRELRHSPTLYFCVRFDSYFIAGRPLRGVLDTESEVLKYAPACLCCFDIGEKRPKAPIYILRIYLTLCT